MIFWNCEFSSQIRHCSYFEYWQSRWFSRSGDLKKREGFNIFKITKVPTQILLFVTKIVISIIFLCHFLHPEKNVLSEMNIVINVVFNLVLIFKKIFCVWNFVLLPNHHESFLMLIFSEIVAGHEQKHGIVLNWIFMHISYIRMSHQSCSVHHQMF